MPSPFTFRTKAKGVWANFTTDCDRCGHELTISNGKVEPHVCRQQLTVWAMHEEVAEGQEFQRATLARLEAALDNL